MLKFRPGAKIVAHHGNVKDSKFDVDFVRRFDVVLNGLDNLEARKHVNRFASPTYLVESGTTGYLGQVTVHVRKRTACFECNPKPTPKSHPICTLRDTPDKPVHCVVYATDLLFPRLFANDPAKSDLDEDDAVELSAFARKDDETGAALPSASSTTSSAARSNPSSARRRCGRTDAHPSRCPRFANSRRRAPAAANGSDATLTQRTACKL